MNHCMALNLIFRLLNFQQVMVLELILTPYYDNRLSDPPTNECAMPDTAKPMGDYVCVDHIKEPRISQRIRKQPKRLLTYEYYI